LLLLRVGSDNDAGVEKNDEFVFLVVAIAFEFEGERASGTTFHKA
jgi:hypothetical protein